LEATQSPKQFNFTEGGASSKGGVTFNHDQCHDCSYVQMITNDCITHLNLLTKQTAEASQRLLQLVELRERVRVPLPLCSLALTCHRFGTALRSFRLKSST
jgi:hypothetical protein